jgi:hypothetical protein
MKLLCVDHGAFYEEKSVFFHFFGGSLFKNGGKSVGPITILCQTHKEG